MEKKELNNINEIGERLLKIIEANPENTEAWSGFKSYIDMIGKMSENLYQLELKAMERPNVYNETIKNFIQL